MYSLIMNENVVSLNQEMLLLRHLLRMGKVTEGRLDSLLCSVDLSSSRLLALQKLEQADQPLSLGQLASCLAFVKSNATQLVDRLEQDALVERIPDPEDRRSTQVRVTDEGMQRLHAGLEVIQPVIDQLHTLYTAEERAQLLSLLERLENALI